MPDPTDNLIAIYKQAYLDVLTTLAYAEGKGNATAYYRGILSDVEDILNGLDADTRAWIEQNLPAIYQQGQQLALDGLKEAGIDTSAMSTSFAGINRQAVEVLAANLYGDLSQANVQIGRHVQDIFRQAGLEAVTRKVSTGQTVREAQARMRQSLIDNGLTAFTDSAGREWNLGAYSEMVIRTTTREATNRGTLGQLSDSGYDLVQIDEHYPTCDICADFQGRVYSISGKDQRYPPLFGTAFDVAYGTIHPNCEHNVTPYIENLADDPEADRKRSARPFGGDPRTEAERQAYLDGQSRKRAARERARDKIDAKLGATNGE